MCIYSHQSLGSPYMYPIAPQLARERFRCRPGLGMTLSEAPQRYWTRGYRPPCDCKDGRHWAHSGYPGRQPPRLLSCSMGGVGARISAANLPANARGLQGTSYAFFALFTLSD
jgi:hypothetical protein